MKNVIHNCFMSYHHSSDYSYLKQLREKIVGRNLSDYGFKEEDLGENSKYYISRKIQYRIWSSSVVIVLIGEKTGESGWIDWEIWYSLQNFRSSKVKRRAFKPKGIVALYLPVKKHNIPERLQANIDNGYAVELKWDEIEDLFDIKIKEAYINRKNVHLIQNQLKLKENPRKFRLLDIFRF